MTDPILIVDPLSPFPYDENLLRSHGFGGVEATVTRVAEKLSARTLIVVAQRNRRVMTRTKNVLYAPLFPPNLYDRWGAVVVLRDPQEALSLRPLCNNAPMWLWMHDLIDTHFLQHLKLLVEQDIGLIVVSDFLQNLLLDMCKSDSTLPSLPRIHRIHNPVDDSIVPDETPVNYNKLIFASAPPKGLLYTLEAFKMIHENYPQFELFVTHPNYTNTGLEQLKMPSVHYLGALSYAENLKHLRSALCLFYLNHVQPETFGIVLADANAVGTPVLTHPLGAAPEVLLNDEQFVNTRDLQAVTDRLVHWRQGNRPKVAVQERFRLSHISQQWEELLF